MLSSTVIRKINRQIEDELRTVDSIASSDEEKIAALDRIARLKDLLTEQPSRQDILKELASALTEARREETVRNTSANIVDAIFGVRR